MKHIKHSSGTQSSALVSTILYLPLSVILLSFTFLATAGAATVEYRLTIDRQQVNITGKPVEAMTINGSIPGPALHFTEGDIARIFVHNNMDVDTSIHWHGILVPPGMDGVPYLTFPPIAPGTAFTYEFPIRQSGTYWYHSHTRLQEQRGLYGPIVIEPRQGSTKNHQNHVILFSDWTDESPDAVIRTLKRGSEWYALAKGSGQAILGAARTGMLGSYFQREFMRMPPMDISNVAYDRFLANGKVESNISGNTGETVRLRIINGSATTYFHIEFAGGPMTIVAADGINVQPVQEKRLLIGVAETYDVLITLPSSGAFEIRGTAHDGSGHASVWIGEGMRHPAWDVPKPNLYHVMHPASLSQALALTPAGAMGMSDKMVDKGMFDAPGMPAMDHETQGHEMDMGHGDNTGMHHMEQQDQPPAMDMQHDVHMQMKGGMQEQTMKKVSATGHSMPAPTISDRSGKQYSLNFGFLAADISSATNLAPDGMGDERPWPPYAKLKAVKPTAFASGRNVHEVSA